MTKVTTKPDCLQPATELAVNLFDNWIDPIETEVRARARRDRVHETGTDPMFERAARFSQLAARSDRHTGYQPSDPKIQFVA